MKHYYQQNTSNLEHLSAYMKERIFGQDHVVDAVADMLYINMAGLGDENKPIASFLFTGPTGVGKTEFAKELATFLGIHFERLDMSEYADEYSARNLTGGQMGLVGYDDGGLLTNAIKENPYCVLLLDEIEKADKSVYNTFLQVLDYGTLKDTQGHKADFSNTIIIMTSNLGATEKRGIGFGENINMHKESAVIEFLSPEFRNRLDMMLAFEPLNSDTIVHVINKYLNDFSKILDAKDVSLTVSEEAKQLLNVMGFESDMGARSVNRLINSEFKKTISKEMLYGRLVQGGSVKIDIDNNQFIYSFDEKKEFLCTEMACSDGDIDFITVEEAQAYARNNPGTVISRAETGFGYIIK